MYGRADPSAAMLSLQLPLLICFQVNRSSFIALDCARLRFTLVNITRDTIRITDHRPLRSQLRFITMFKRLITDYDSYRCHYKFGISLDTLNQSQFDRLDSSDKITNLK